MNTTNPTETGSTGTDSPATEAADSRGVLFTEVQGQSDFGVRAETRQPLGIQLRNARESKGLSCEDVAQKLRLPHTVIEAIEAEHYERIGYGIYLRGYLSKYLDLLGLPNSLASDVLDAHAKPPPLVTTKTLSRPRYLFERYSGSALYLILTGVIIVPSVLLAMHAGINHNVGRISLLDRPLAKPHPVSAAGQNSLPAPTTNTVGKNKATTPSQATPKSQTPLAASMAPFNASADKTPNEKTSVAPVVTPPAAKPKPPMQTHDLHIQLVHTSWVEIVNGAGQQLEYGLLPAGSERDYHSDDSLRVLLGNASGANVSIDGRSCDLAPYQHGNVARFHLAQGDWSISPSGG